MSPWHGQPTCTSTIPRQRLCPNYPVSSRETSALGDWICPLGPLAVHLSASPLHALSPRDLPLPHIPTRFPWFTAKHEVTKAKGCHI